MNDYIDASKAAEMLKCDAQTLRDTVRKDMEDGTNADNWNARRLGNRTLFSKADIEAWLKGRGVGPVIRVSEALAEKLVKLGLAEAQDG